MFSYNSFYFYKIGSNVPTFISDFSNWDFPLFFSLNLAKKLLILLIFLKIIIIYYYINILIRYILFHWFFSSFSILYFIYLCSNIYRFLPSGTLPPLSFGDYLHGKLFSNLSF